jgi:hypothetical protein
MWGQKPRALAGEALFVIAAILAWRGGGGFSAPVARNGPVLVHPTAAFDTSPPLASLRGFNAAAAHESCIESDCGTSPGDSDQDLAGGTAQVPRRSAAGGKIEQNSQGSRPPLRLLASFDGLGVGFEGPQGAAAGRNPSDNSLAFGPNHIVQIVNSRLVIFTRKGALFAATGKVLIGALPTNNIFKGFGGACEARNHGDAVIRYDQLAGRWLLVMPLPANCRAVGRTVLGMLRGQPGRRPARAVSPLRIPA